MQNLVSIITPLHKAGNQYIQETYESLLKQTNQNYEWIIVKNHGGEVPDSFNNDNRIKLFHSTKNGIGALKKEASSYATGDIIVELDADDQLLPEALAEIKAAFTPGIVFVYSDAIEYNEDGTTQIYSSYWGWEKSNIKLNEKDYEYNLSFDVTPASIRQISWAPNHVRAWLREAYNEILGHDETIFVGDDHELILRFYVNYGSAGFKYIKKVLYLYRLHDGNTYKAKGDIIFDQSLANYNKYLYPITTRWAKDNNLRCLDLGGRLNSANGFESVDLFDSDIIADLSKPWPFEDNSVGVLRASDFVEHIGDPIHLMNEAYRVLAPGGWFMISVPSTDGRGAFQDPTHISFWNENSFWYYTNENYAKYIPKFIGKFQLSHLVTFFPTEWHKEHNISYVNAELICGKPNYKPVGEWLWQHQ